MDTKISSTPDTEEIKDEVSNKDSEIVTTSEELEATLLQRSF